MAFNYIQTFYLDPNTVNGASECSLTSVDLFLRSKPKATGNKSGVTNPGVVIAICPATSDSASPMTSIHNSTVRVGFDMVYGTSDASIPTQFVFPHPISLQTGRYYGIVVSFEDPDYVIWKSTAGDKLVNTNIVSSGPSGINDGLLFEGSNSILTADHNSDLKFQINAARYSSNTASFQLISDDYEFLEYSAISNTLFLGGEKVYTQTANATGTIVANQNSTTIIGSGSLFESEVSAGSKIVITDGTTGNTDIRTVRYITSNTSLTVDVPPAFDASSAAIKVTSTAEIYYPDYVNKKLILTNSSSNSTIAFAGNTTIVGEVTGATANISAIYDFSIDTFVPQISFTLPSSASLDVDYLFASSNGAGGFFSNVGSFTDTVLDKSNVVTKYDAFVASRVNEVTSAGSLYTGKSAVLNASFNIKESSSDLYQTPSIYGEKIDVLTFQNKINNDSSNEHTDAGNALTKYISNRITLSDDRFAEDIRTYVTAYIPEGTSIEVYARVHNSNDHEPFDDKNWTKLRKLSSTSGFSSLTNPNDFIEISYGFPQYPQSNNSLVGTFTTTNGSAVITSTVDQSSAISSNDLIKLYSPLFPETSHQIASVASVNSTAITLQDVISNVGMIGSGYRADVLKLPQTAFNNILNDNVVRYYSSTMSEYDTYDTMSIKVVLLSNSTYIVPLVEDIRSIAVSA